MESEVRRLTDNYLFLSRFLTYYQAPKKTILCNGFFIAS